MDGPNPGTAAKLDVLGRSCDVQIRSVGSLLGGDAGGRSTPSKLREYRAFENDMRYRPTTMDELRTYLPVPCPAEMPVIERCVSVKSQTVASYARFAWPPGFGSCAFPSMVDGAS